MNLLEAGWDILDIFHLNNTISFALQQMIFCAMVLVSHLNASTQESERERVGRPDHGDDVTTLCLRTHSY